MPKKSKPLNKVAVVVLNWNGYEDTKDCLKSLQKVKDPDITIVVVDNGSEDDSLAKLKNGFADLKFIETGKNLGYAGGNNAGISWALHENFPYVLVINNDTFVESDFLEKMLATLHSYEAGIVSPMVYYVEPKNKIWSVGGGKIDFWKGRTNDLGNGEIDLGQYFGIREQDRCSGACMLVRKEVFEKIGLFDESYFLQLEEVDFSVRAKRAGFKIMVNPTAKIWHKASSASGGEYSALGVYFFTRNMFYFMSRYASLLQRIFFTILEPLRMLKASITIYRHKPPLRRALLRGYVDYLAGIRGSGPYQ